ncbi:SDR family NAD(P)-dependent oxidoreductase [Gemmatimonas sp.]|uniref:SDR family NAD(P)-dependent oxidoreductase n=1 Tax=Gemmatimonas sp. TaxID=1962908 RepID=UPI003DA41034
MNASSNQEVVLITGAATGIGAACARAFARANWRVAIATLGATMDDAEARESRVRSDWECGHGGRARCHQR